MNQHFFASKKHQIEQIAIVEDKVIRFAKLLTIPLHLAHKNKKPLAAGLPKLDGCASGLHRFIGELIKFATQGFQITYDALTSALDPSQEESELREVRGWWKEEQTVFIDICRQIPDLRTCFLLSNYNFAFRNCSPTQSMRLALQQIANENQ